MRQPWMRGVAGGCAVLLALGLAAVSNANAAGTEPAWLGVTTQTIDDELRDGLNYDGRGVLVSRVVDGSAAERAGIERGDVITSFNSRTVTSSKQLTELVRGTNAGQTVAIGIVRDGVPRTLSAKLEAAPPTPPTPESWSAPMAPMAPMSPMSPMAPMAPMAPMTSRHMYWSDRDAMMSGGRGRLGVQVQDINEDLGDYFGVKNGRGALITSVVKDSPADSVGIKAGDVIVQVGDQTIDDTSDLTDAVRDAGTSTRITVVRKGARRTFEPHLRAGRRVSWSSDSPMRWKTQSGGPMVWHGDDDDDDVMIRRVPGPDGDKHVIIRRFDDGDGEPEVLMRGMPGHDGDHDLVIRRVHDDQDSAELKKEIDELRQQVEELRAQMKKPAPTTAAPKKSTTTKSR